MERLYDLFDTLTPEGTVRSKPPGGTTYLYQWSEDKQKGRKETVRDFREQLYFELYSDVVRFFA